MLFSSHNEKNREYVWMLFKKEVPLQRFYEKQAVFEVEQEGEPL